jgi:hypothetical protein
MVPSRLSAILLDGRCKCRSNIARIIAQQGAIGHGEQGLCHPDQSVFALPAMTDCRGTWVSAGATQPVAQAAQTQVPRLSSPRKARLGTALGMTSFQLFALGGLSSPHAKCGWGSRVGIRRPAMRPTPFVIPSLPSPRKARLGAALGMTGASKCLHPVRIFESAAETRREKPQRGFPR